MDEKKKKGVLKGVMQKVNVLTPNAVPQESRPKKTVSMITTLH